MNNKQVLVCGVLESANDLRSSFCGTHPFEETYDNFEKLSKYFIVTQEQEIRFF